jgi:hypothetical protein
MQIASPLQAAAADTPPRSPIATPSARTRAPVLLALDLGSQTGWAAQAGEGPLTSGTVTFRPGRFEGGGMAFLRFKRWLDELQETVGAVGAVYFEEVRGHRGTIAAHIYGGFLGQLEAWCEYHEIPYQGVPVGTIKRHVTGRGNADKQTVIAAIRARGYEPADDNEADAIAILLWATETGGGVR